jgi:hypothetical protein
MAIVYNVQVHPVYNGIVQFHRVLQEFEFNTEHEAVEYVKSYNAVMASTLERLAQYTGAIDTTTGENL